MSSFSNLDDSCANYPKHQSKAMVQEKREEDAAIVVQAVLRKSGVCAIPISSAVVLVVVITG